MKIKAAQQKFTDEFKEQAVEQVTEHGHKASEVASRLGVSTNSLYTWIISSTARSHWILLFY